MIPLWRRGSVEPKRGVEPPSPSYESGALPLSYFGAKLPYRALTASAGDWGEQ